MKKAILAVSFGTSHLDTLEKNIAAIERDLALAMPDREPRRAFTSGMIMKKLLERDGLSIPNTAEALEALADEGFEDVVIQPTHVLNGDEYDKLRAQAAPYEERFERMSFGAPLLTETEDYRALARAVLPTLPEKRSDTAIVYMGHGTGHHANAVYAMLDYMFRDMGREDIHIGTVEGYPGLDEVRRRVYEQGAENVLLLPLMIVAGDHAKNDLAGDDEDSWKQVFLHDGKNVRCVLSGLGENPAVRRIFVRHALRAGE
ncbi:MAG: sirohydrochlorin cobaltochelatase [Candidatus Heteroscillospira sp.]|jgi:sirohydrochlorin cobaltochelatase